MYMYVSLCTYRFCVLLFILKLMKCESVFFSLSDLSEWDDASRTCDENGQMQFNETTGELITYVSVR